jgi:cation transport ATPase
MVLRGASASTIAADGRIAPVAKSVGDLIAGSLNYDGALEYRATAIGAESRLGQILRLVEQAQSSRAPMQQLADRVSAIFVPAIIALAVATFAAWSFVDVSRAFAINLVPNLPAPIPAPWVLRTRSTHGLSMARAWCALQRQRSPERLAQ